MYQINKINKLKISDAVFEQLKQNILRQEQTPGSKLPSENQLAEMFGVSRTSVRAAIQRLVSMGLVETRNGDGTYVREPNVGSFLDPLFSTINYEARQVLEILEFRLAIEILSCRLAAQHANRQQIEELRIIVENMQNQVRENNSKQYSVEDMKFHRCVSEMSGNSIIVKVVQGLSEFYLGHFVEMNDQIGLDFGVGYHVGIYEAIRDEDPDTAERLMRQSITRSIEEVKKWRKE